MGVQIRSKARDVSADKASQQTGLWGWLKRKENRTVLQFIGAATVALIGLLTTLGILHQPAPPESHPVSAAGVIAASPPAPQPVTQNAVANGGNATTQSGSDNQVVIKK